MAWVCVELGGVAPNEMRRGRGGLETVLRLLALLVLLCLSHKCNGSSLFSPAPRSLVIPRPLAPIRFTATHSDAPAKLAWVLRGVPNNLRQWCNRSPWESVGRSRDFTIGVQQAVSGRSEAVLASHSRGAGGGSGFGRPWLSFFVRFA